MIEAVGVVVAPLAEARPAEKLLALYASGLKAEAGKLTLGMIKETAESIKLSPKVVKWVQAEDARARTSPIRLRRWPRGSGTAGFAGSGRMKGRK
jgi:hypothetical protein